MFRRAHLVSIIFATAFCNPAPGQVPAAILKVELQNGVEYQVDTSDLSKFGTNSNATSGGFSGTGGVQGAGCLGNTVVGLADIVAVNGHPAKGKYTSRGVGVCLAPAPAKGQTLADTTAATIRFETYEFLQSDGTPVGTIMTNGLSASLPTAPGPPAGALNYAIVGGTGAFLGARGQAGKAMGDLAAPVPFRLASITEDAGNRRQNGGGHQVYTLYMIPMSQPAIVTTAGVPAVTHSNDFTLVSASKPAAAGEILSLFAIGLGPTLPGVILGQPFPSSPLAGVNSPIDVTVNGKSAEVLGAVGYPGASDGYQVNFRMPSDAAKGTATIQVSAAWIAGAPVSVPVQ
jgi:uncharacterized protein (TIGR03437 family)